MNPRVLGGVLLAVGTFIVLVTIDVVFLVYWLRCHLYGSVKDSTRVQNRGRDDVDSTRCQMALDGSRETGCEPEELNSLVDTVKRLNREGILWKAVLNPSVDPDLFLPTPHSHFDHLEMANVSADANWTFPQSFTKLLNIWNDYHLWKDSVSHMKTLSHLSGHLPKHFDARVKWPLCNSIRSIRNQGNCGSCWAESVTSAISDRICISSNQTLNARISSVDLIDCCEDCGNCSGSNELLFSYDYYVHSGIVTGGSFKSFEGCKPYEYSTDCGFPCPLKDQIGVEKPKECRRHCSNGYLTRYEDDKYYGDQVLILPSLFYPYVNVENSTIAAVMKPMVNLSDDQLDEILKAELFLHGPFVMTFTVTADFLLYSTGVYHPSGNPGRVVYMHSVKVFGWGEQDLSGPVDLVRDNPHKTSRLHLPNLTRIPYWLAANSWGRNWGDDGFFKIIRSPQLMPEMYVDNVVAIPRHRQSE